MPEMLQQEPEATPRSHPHPHEMDTTLRDRMDIVLEKLSGPETWTVTPNGFWCYVSPPGHQRRDQGWKIHVSATPLSAADVLERAAEVLVGHRASFKYARGLREVEDLVSSRADRGSGGKFITVYPDHDDHFREIINELDQATRGFPGPGILSDRPYAPGSLVHYRYGGFSPRQVLNTEGSYEFVLVRPDGNYLRDRRRAWFDVPAWAPPPLPDIPAAKPDSARGRQVLLADRFVVTEAIRQSFRGGVYRGVDNTTGGRVVIKQARPYVGADLLGKDARDWMRHEAEMLDEFAPLEFTPRKVELFEYQGDLFLAEEELEGKSLRHWRDERKKQTPDGGISAEDADTMARALVALVRQVHDKGYVIRDLNPGNIVVPGDNLPRLVDLEFVARPGEPVRNISTFGYTAPEQLRSPRHGPAPAQTVDLFSLGATLLNLATGIDPVGPEDEPPARPVGERLASFVRASAASVEACRRLAPLILGLTADDPQQRWSLKRAAEFLAMVHPDRIPVPSGDALLSAADQERMLRGGLAYTLATMKLDEPHLWPPIVAEGLTSDPCNVQAGAGGVVAMLTRAAAELDEPELWDGLARATQWLDRRIPEEPRVLPGLYFGRSGTAWAYYDAARALGDDEMTERALTFARRVPIRWPNPDMTHGTAGAGTAMLHLFRATGDPRFADRVHGCARSLIAAAKREGGTVGWPVPLNFRSEMSGISHLGYAHGVAGVSTFLLSAGQALDCPEYVELALAGADALRVTAQLDGDAARWPTGEEGAEHIGLTWWCSGSAGIGTFLIRLWQVTGDTWARDLIAAAAVAVRSERWLYSPSGCHGGTGGAEFLLDAAASLGDARYRDWAEEMTMCIYARHTFRGGHLVVPGDSMSAIDMGYNSGLAGVLALLLRLRNGGLRMWMVDDLALPAPVDARVGDGR